MHGGVAVLEAALRAVYTPDSGFKKLASAITHTSVMLQGTHTTLVCVDAQVSLVATYTKVMAIHIIENESPLRCNDSFLSDLHTVDTSSVGSLLSRALHSALGCIWIQSRVNVGAGWQRQQIRHQQLLQQQPMDTKRPSQRGSSDQQPASTQRRVGSRGFPVLRSCSLSL